MIRYVYIAILLTIVGCARPLYIHADKSFITTKIAQLDIQRSRFTAIFSTHPISVDKYIKIAKIHKWDWDVSYQKNELLNIIGSKLTERWFLQSEDNTARKETSAFKNIISVEILNFEYGTYGSTGMSGGYVDAQMRIEVRDGFNKVVYSKVFTDKAFGNSHFFSTSNQLSNSYKQAITEVIINLLNKAFRDIVITFEKGVTN